ncbi:major facilitator superfamily domain-containing protein [Microdochium trichocladiopsis]|uniref:Major facilitator superfamily domain-containing protein n=1 Tax=Microdochium trichocladiopsis TaxID=1682393 RepID=A0A9P8XTY7_9PEZI|nr:major facilitator superfamily domain-containing protein [Microdochium trichocladiopsis]KAH7012469.1 major facilitator superfamily domain-containing protein [Microdochium trichocladiopsis]
MGMFIAFRFLSGAGSSACLALSGGMLADVIPREDRAKWMSLFVLGPLLGPVIGPIAGGFAAENLGWRWAFRIILILCAAVGALCVDFLRETYAPVILRRRAARRRKEQGQPAKVESLPMKEVAARMASTITRPLRLLVFSPIVLFLSLSAAFAFELLLLLFTGFAIVFKGQYGWSTGISGLAYVELGNWHWHARLRGHPGSIQGRHNGSTEEEKRQKQTRRPTSDYSVRRANSASRYVLVRLVREQALEIPLTPLPSSQSGWDDGLHFAMELRDWTVKHAELVAKPNAASDQYVRVYVDGATSKLPRAVTVLARKMLGSEWDEAMRNSLKYVSASDSVAAICYS